jgi:uncharacterized membrane protein YdjX (TVP38/TMEM64 family)
MNESIDLHCCRLRTNLVWQCRQHLHNTWYCCYNGNTIEAHVEAQLSKDINSIKLKNIPLEVIKMINYTKLVRATLPLALAVCLCTTDAFVSKPLASRSRAPMSASTSTTSLNAFDFASLFPSMDPQLSFESTGAMIASLAKEEGPLSMVLAVALADSIPLVPTQPISLLAGAVFGLKIGLPAVILGQAVATTFAMVVGRYILAKRGDFQESLEGKEDTSGDNKLAKVLDELTAGLNSDNWKTVFGTILLARQSPVLPFSIGNYFVGASTQAPLVPSVVATVVACIPLNCLWVGAGAGGMAAVDMVTQNGALAEGLEVVGLLATSAIVLSIAKVFYKVWNEEPTISS